MDGESDGGMERIKLWRESEGEREIDKERLDGCMEVDKKLWEEREREVWGK